MVAVGMGFTVVGPVGWQLWGTVAVGEYRM